MLEEEKLRKAKVWWDSVKPWRKQSRGQAGIKPRNRFGKSTKETGKTKLRGVSSEEWEVRQDVVTSDAILGRSSSDYDEEGRAKV